MEMKKMIEKEYLEFLKTFPQDHITHQFVDYLRERNEVVEETNHWLIIKNVKYGWLTAFYTFIPWRSEQLDHKQESHEISAYQNLSELRIGYSQYEWLIKAPAKRTVKLFHVHLIEKTKIKVEPKWRCNCATYDHRGYHAKYCLG